MTTTTTTTPAVTVTPAAPIKTPTIATMLVRMDALSELMSFPIEYAASSVEVKWSRKAKKEVILKVLNKMEKALIQRTQLVADVEALGGTATIKNTARELMNMKIELTPDEEVTTMVKETPVEEVAPTIADVEEQLKEIELIIAPKKEEAPMEETKVTSSNEFITQGDFNETMGAMIQEMSTLFKETADKTHQRLNEAAHYTQALAKRMDALEKPAVVIAPTVEVPPATETPIEVDPQVRVKELVERINAHHGKLIVTEHMPLSMLEQLIKDVPAVEIKVEQAPATPAVPVPGVDENTIVYSETQIIALEKAKAVSNEKYRMIKDAFDKMNSSLGRTVGGTLHKTALYFDDQGHKGVDSVADLLGKTIESARVVAHSVVDLSATTLVSVNEIGRSAGHIIINGVVHTLDAAGNIISK